MDDLSFATALVILAGLFALTYGPALLAWHREALERLRRDEATRARRRLLRRAAAERRNAERIYGKW